MADVDVVRTVFQSEWIGGGAVSQMIRQYGLAEKAVSQMGAKGGKGAAALGTGLDVAGAKANIATRELSRLSHEVAMNRMTLAEATVESGKYSAALNETGVEAGGLLSNLSPLTIGLGVVAAAVVGAVVAFKTLYPALEAGAEIAQLESSFDNLNRSVGSSVDLLDEMRAASQGTVSTMAAQEGFMTLVAGSSDEMAKSLADAAPKLLEISKAANKLNPALGDTNFLFRSLAKGVKRAEPRLIDNLGLKLRVADANRTLAAELGKSVLALTAEEKQLAILNETLRAGDQLVAQVGGTVDGLGDSFLRAEVATTEFKNKFKQNLFYMVGITGVQDRYTKGLGRLAQAMDDQVAIRKAIIDGLIEEKEARHLLLLAGDLGADRDRKELIDGLKAIDARRDAMEKEKQAYKELVDEYVRGKREFLTSPEVPQLAEVIPTTDVGEGRRLGSEDDTLSRQFQFNKREKAREQEIKDQEELVKALDKSQKEEAAIFKASLDAANKWADGVNAASQEARDAWIAYTAELGATAKAMADADAKSSLFTTSIMAIGDGWRETGGATEEQTELIEDLQGAYDKAEKSVRDLQSGVKGFGQDEEKTAEQIEKNLAAMDHYKTKIDGVAVAETELVRTHQEAAWNWDNVRTALGAAAEEAGIGAVNWTKMQVAMGEMTDEQAIAVLQATAMQTKIKELGGAMTEAGGSLSFADAMKELRDFETELANTDFSIILNPVLDTDEQVDAATRRLDDKLARMEGEDGVKIPVGADTETAQNTLIEEFFGEGALEPAIITAEVDADEATKQLTIWRTEMGKEPVRIPVELVYPDAPIGNGANLPPPPKAGGGNLMAGHMALVGEQGPELIVPGSNSTAIPNNKLGDGNGVNITINVNGDSGDGLAMIVQDSLLEAMQQVGIL